MPSLKSIRTRISSVKSTCKMTSAMKMVAGAKLVRAQQHMLIFRSYAKAISELLRAVSVSSTPGGSEIPLSHVHPLFAHREEKRVLFVLFSSDRGLCGGFNTNLNKITEREWNTKTKEEKTVEFATIGRKGRDFFIQRGAHLQRDFTQVYENINLEQANHIAQWLIPGAINGEWDAIYLFYNQFKNALAQQVTYQKLLPFSFEDPEPISSQAAQEGIYGSKEYLFEPNPQNFVQMLVPKFIQIGIYTAMLESYASELAARMATMDAATQNAKEMIKRLTLVYNRARQASITKELIEILGGAEALKA
ncbi:ATP synthase F1 subunit gamma [Pajaroellobacter abortibovis]|uniref:ATP synthase gamma chain n=1 Tax=Pajaroellobacter abortibovis TaxID=1882918 RepID=A0A1L6MXW7_9BACT|nr:ATP synthase F1 subunit gamma [Pajaroellobacter abortibovis]APS00451.1 ATP synthase F1 subunit gamma [Pajaroellobacter abortibovis]